MKSTFQLTFDDYLTHQLYISSKSKIHKRNRLISRLSPLIILSILGIVLIYFSKVNLGITYIGVGLILFLIFPFYLNWKYKRHFKRHIKENYSSRINSPIEVEFNSSFLKTKDTVSESTINYSEIKEVIELSNHFLLKLSTNMSLIIPKLAIENKEEFFSIFPNSKYVDETNWKW